MKKALGILFIIISIPLIILFFWLLIAHTLPEVTKLLNDFNASQLGAVIGAFLFLLVIAVPLLLLLIFGVKWIQLPFRKANPTQLPEFPSQITNRDPQI